MRPCFIRFLTRDSNPPPPPREPTSLHYLWLFEAEISCQFVPVSLADVFLSPECSLQLLPLFLGENGPPKDPSAWLGTDVCRPHSDICSFWNIIYQDSVRRCGTNQLLSLHKSVLQMKTIRGDWMWRKVLFWCWRRSSNRWFSVQLRTDVTPPPCFFS